MAAFEVVDPPRGLSYAAPAVDFGIIGDLGNTYYQGQNNARQAAVADAFKDQPLPLDPATGLPDYGKIMQVLAQKGGIDAITKLAPAATEQSLINRAGQISPLLGGPAASGPAGGGTVAAPSPPMQAAPQPAPQSGGVTAQSIPAPPAAQSSPNYVQGGDQSGSVVDIVTSKLPQNSQATGSVIVNIAKSVGVDPNATLTPEQSALVQRRLDGYLKRTGPAAPPAAAPAAPAAGPLTPQTHARSAGQPNARVADAFTAMPASAGAPQVPPTAQASAAGPQGQPQAVAGPQSGPQQQSAGQPIVPQVPLPPGYTDPQRAIMALRAEAAKRASNPYDKQAPQLSAWADRIEQSLQPIKVGQSETIVDPRTGQVLIQGPMAKAMSGASGGINAVTLDADAERYRQTGTLPPNMGRGVQGQAEASAIRARAVEHETAAGGNPDEWATRWQEYRARGVGMNTGERVRASREENLNLILKVTDAAIPAALEQSAKVWRSGFVPLNKIIQHGEVMTSDPELRAFGMANLQLAEGWARAMNPTGVMRNEDREKALSFLSTADSPETYRRLVTQLKTQITRERDSIRKGEPMRSGDSAPAPGVQASAAKSDDAGWVTVPTSGGGNVRIREVGGN